MHFDPKIQNLLITVYYFLLMSSLLSMQISLGYAYTLEFTGLRPGIYWATPSNLLGYALEFTITRVGSHTLGNMMISKKHWWFSVLSFWVLNSLGEYY